MTLKSHIKSSDRIEEVRAFALGLLKTREEAIEILKSAATADAAASVENNDLITLCRKARGEIEALRGKAEHWEDVSEQQSKSLEARRVEMLLLIATLFPEADAFELSNISWDDTVARVRSLKKGAPKRHWPQQQCKDCLFLTDNENKHGERICRWHPLYVDPTWGGCVNFTNDKTPDCSTCSNIADDCYDEFHGAMCPNYEREDK